MVKMAHQNRKINEIILDNPYLRLNDDVSDLEKSIKTLGLLSPLIISDENKLLAGARRWQALKNLGYKEVPVFVVSFSELEQELISIDENLVRKDLTKFEVEEHLKRAKEIYQSIHPDEFTEHKEAKEKSESNKERLPGQDFLEKIAEKTGMSPRQIHQAIGRQEKAAKKVLEARKKGELSVSQTNEIIRLGQHEQERSLDHIKDRPVREIKNFVKIAKAQGVDKAIQLTPRAPHAREFLELEQATKKLNRILSKLEVENIELSNISPSCRKELINLAEKLTQKISSREISNENVGDDHYRQSSDHEQVSMH